MKRKTEKEFEVRKYVVPRFKLTVQPFIPDQQEISDAKLKLGTFLENQFPALFVFSM